MPRSIFSIDIADLSTFAKSLREQIGRLDRQPSHVEMLNLLSRAAGFRNFQHLRAARTPPRSKWFAATADTTGDNACQ